MLIGELGMKILFESDCYRICRFDAEYNNQAFLIFSQDCKGRWELTKTVESDGSVLYSLIEDLLKRNIDGVFLAFPNKPLSNELPTVYRNLKDAPDGVEVIPVRIE